MNDKLRKFLQLMSYFTLVLCFVVGAIIFTWLVKDYQPIVFSNQPFEVLTLEVSPGEHVVYEVEYCKNNDLIPVSTKSFVDGVIYMIPSDPQPYLKEGCQIVEFQVYIPRALPESDYHIEGTYTFQVNPLRKVDVHFKTEKFKVIK